jgi:hypothetical protein
MATTVVTSGVGGTDGVAPGTSGNLLTSDGTNWTSAAAAGGGGWEFVSTQTASASATVAFTGMETGYDYRVVMAGVIPGTDDKYLQALLGITGPTYRTSNYLGHAASISASGSAGGFESTTYIRITEDSLGTATDESGMFNFNLVDPAAATDTYWLLDGWFRTNGATKMTGSGGGHYTSAEAHTAIQFSMQTGNIASGVFKLYRRANA